MPAPTISHLICTSALLILIFVMPFFYSIVVIDIRAGMMQRELKEIADYVSNTLANLYFLANSTNYLDTNLTKELIYLPSTVEGSVYILKIDGNDGKASKISAHLKDKTSVAADAWLIPGLKIGAENSVESGQRTVIVGCRRNSNGIYVWIKYE